MMKNSNLQEQDITAWFACYQFLAQEAECLDENRVTEWLDLLTTDIHYEMPILVTRLRGEDPVVENGWHMKETFASLQARVARLGTDSAWGEDPPTRTRRVIGNVRAGQWNEGKIDVKSNLLLYLGRGDSAEYTVLAAERQDILRKEEQGLRLARRRVLLSHTTLPTQSIGVFL
ncbi:MAG: aromatic-ring-hydroxylating dioxygenase subunit beta [Proteobacteria bacterium]|nr:aromatic-ring-hydroxylating dioxygenase subunit beta [Pseudomonadota bacterium]